MKTSNILISAIRRDGGTQIRAALDESTVADYAALIKAVSQYNLPSVVVYFDGTDHWLSDGFHRIEAALRAGAVRTPCEVRNGTQRDAILAACGANAEHGLRRSNADKRNAVNTLLNDPEWSKWSDRRIAKETHVEHHLVASLREQNRAVKSPSVITGMGEPPLLHTAASKSGQPTAGLPRSPANPTLEGDEGAGDGCITVHVQVSAPSIDLLGLDDIDPAWLEFTDDVVAALDAFDNHMRQAQASVYGTGDRIRIGSELQALRAAAHDLAARARKSVRPRSVCLYCKDPDGTAGRRARCNGCRELGWLTEEQLGAVPRELEAKGPAAKVIDTERGGYMPVTPIQRSVVDDLIAEERTSRARTLKIELVDEAGASTPYEEETDSDGEPAW